MKLYIDGDALPNMLKTIMLRAIIKNNILTFVVSNKKISIGEHSTIKYVIVKEGADEADKHIVDMLSQSDLVITADIPLADLVISKGGYAIDHRGDIYTEDNIKHFLAMRDLMQNLRESGEITKGPKPFNKNDVQKFANSFNSMVQKLL